MTCQTVSKAHAHCTLATQYTERLELRDLKAMQKVAFEFGWSVYSLILPKEELHLKVRCGKKQQAGLERSNKPCSKKAL